MEIPRGEIFDSFNEELNQDIRNLAPAMIEPNHELVIENKATQTHGKDSSVSDEQADMLGKDHSDNQMGEQHVEGRYKENQQDHCDTEGQDVVQGSIQDMGLNWNTRPSGGNLAQTNVEVVRVQEQQGPTMRDEFSLGAIGEAAGVGLKRKGQSLSKARVKQVKPIGTEASVDHISQAYALRPTDLTLPKVSTVIISSNGKIKERARARG